MKVGRCGWMTHYEEWEDGSMVLKGMLNSKEKRVTWMDSLYEVLKNVILNI